MSKMNGADKQDLEEKLKEDKCDYRTPISWYICIILGIQHFLAMCTPNAIATLILLNSLCLEDDSAYKSQLISTSFFVMGISTFMQTILGCRLPIIQGATYSILIPTMSLMNMPAIQLCNISNDRFIEEHFPKMTKPESMFHLKIRLISGALMATSIVEIMIAACGILVFIRRLLSPLSIAAMYTVLSLAISESLINMISEQWTIGILGIVFMTILSVILSPRSVPIPIWKRNAGCTVKRIKIFQISPIITALVIIWLFCGLLTLTGAFSKDPKGWGYAARTDIKLNAIYNSPIFKIPYPTQWGAPIVIPSAVIGMSAGILISIIESVSDYVITAETINIPRVPQFAINRGILVEGISVFLSGLLGSAVAPTSYSDNIGVMKITKAGNRLIAQVAAAIMIVCGIFPVIGAVFVSIPNPAIGGIVFIVSLMIMGCGITNLQMIDFHSTRNALVFGFSVSFGLFIPYLIKRSPDMFAFGYKPIDEIIQILFSINLFIATVLSVFLDNVLPGRYNDTKPDEFELEIGQVETTMTDLDICTLYDLNILKWIAHKCPFLQYLPLFPAYRKLERQQKLTDPNQPNVTTEM